MKTKPPAHILGMIFIGLISLPGDLLAVSVFVTPNAISIPYTGSVSLTVTGLAVGKTILVERFVDVNGNGAVDVGVDPLIHSFKVTDGHLPLIGGVRNINVPGDDDGATNGAIRVDFPFPGIDNTFATIIAKSIFRISDPQNSFTPVIAALQVTQSVQPQRISGRITAASGGAPVSGAFVALTASSGSSVAATITDVNGNYFFYTSPGSFVVNVIQNGFVTDLSAAAVTVVANQFATKNLLLANAGFTVSGRISDSRTGAGIAGVFVTGESTDRNYFAGGLTDASGNYSFAVKAGEWEIRNAESQLAQAGYLKPENVRVNTTDNGTTTINFAAPKADALIYGTVKDGANNPVIGLGIDAGDQGHLYEGTGVSFFPNGNYALGVLAGTWQVGPINDDLAARGYIGDNTDVTLNSSEAVLTNFVVLAVTAHLRGQIKDDAGIPISNMTIDVVPASGGNGISLRTDSNGNFDAGVRADTWEISLACDEAQGRGFVNVTGHDFTVTDSVDQNNIVLTFPVSTATISGSVKDNLGQPIAGLELHADQPIGGGLSHDPGCASTDSNGNYTIKVLGGTWTVSILTDDLNARGFNGVTDKNAIISGGTGVADFVATPLPPEITSPTTAGGTTGLPFVYQFQTRFPASKAVTNLPAGLTFNSQISAIVGIPTVAGSFSVGLSASNTSGTANVTLSLTVQPAPPSGPVITSSTSATGRSNKPFSFQVITTGGSPATRVSATDLPSGLTLDSTTGLISGSATTEASIAVSLTAVDGGFTATSQLQLTFTADPTVPVIVSSSSASLSPGQAFSYTISAPATVDPNDVTAFTLIGTLPMGLVFDPNTGTISGIFTANILRAFKFPSRPDLSGGIVSNVQLFATNSHGTSTIPLNFFLAPTGAVNISTRLAVGGGDNVLIAGFILSGNAPKKVIIRAIGPSSHVPGAMQDPTLELHDANTTLGSNDNWRDMQENEIIASTVAPTDDRESAIVATLESNNATYTAIVRSKDNTPGIAVVELYDLGTASLDTSSTAKLAEISTRGTVLTNDQVMIGGFIISGQATKVIMRAIGPSLTALGVSGALEDPILELRDGSGSLINMNDDWQSTQEQQIKDTGVPPSDPRESAVVATLSPGSYTGIVRGKNNTTGVALVEVYGLQ
jgi:Carboxypeptidase regulatory-like domain/Putative Ig domain